MYHSDKKSEILYFKVDNLNENTFYKIRVSFIGSINFYFIKNFLFCSAFV